MHHQLIANLLYANLKIKKILDEYNEIQARAEELLQDDSINFPEGKMLVNDHESADNPKEDEPEESSIYEKLHQKLISLSTYNLSEVNIGDTETENTTQAPQAQVSMLSFLHLQKKTESPLQASNAKQL